MGPTRLRPATFWIRGVTTATPRKREARSFLFSGAHVAAARRPTPMMFSAAGLQRTDPDRPRHVHVRDQWPNKFDHWQCMCRVHESLVRGLFRTAAYPRCIRGAPYAQSRRNHGATESACALRSHLHWLACESSAASRRPSEALPTQGRGESDWGLQRLGRSGGGL